jgi:hypothetical protein
VPTRWRCSWIYFELHDLDGLAWDLEWYRDEFRRRLDTPDRRFALPVARQKHSYSFRPNAGGFAARGEPRIVAVNVHRLLITAASTSADSPRCSPGLSSLGKAIGWYPHSRPAWTRHTRQRPNQRTGAVLSALQSRRRSQIRAPGTPTYAASAASGMNCDAGPCIAASCGPKRGSRH